MGLSATNSANGEINFTLNCHSLRQLNHVVGYPKQLEEFVKTLLYMKTPFIYFTMFPHAICNMSNMRLAGPGLPADT